MIKFFNITLIQYSFIDILDTFSCKFVIQIDDKYFDIYCDIKERNKIVEQQLPFFIRKESYDAINIVIDKDYLIFEIEDVEYKFSVNNIEVSNSSLIEKYDVDDYDLELDF